MDKPTIKTDRKWKDFIYGYQLTEKEKNDLDYRKWDDPEDDCRSMSFFRYHGNIYDLGEIMRLDDKTLFPGWHGYSSDTYFSGIVIKVSNDGERYQVGYYFS
jgi:hypothetical protein